MIILNNIFTVDLSKSDILLTSASEMIYLLFVLIPAFDMVYFDKRDTLSLTVCLSPVSDLSTCSYFLNSPFLTK